MDFDANKARQLTDSFKENRIKKLVEHIEESAGRGASSIKYAEALTQEERTWFLHRGFRVVQPYWTAQPHDGVLAVHVEGEISW